MRVMWFVNIPMPAMDARLGQATKGSGWWMSTLLDALRSQPGLNLAVVTAHAGAPPLAFEEQGVDYFVVPEQRRDSDDVLVDRCSRIVKEWNPDLIHVHGTERCFGLLRARRRVDCPLIVSIQGMLGPCSRHFYGDMSFWEIVRSHRLRDLVRGGGLWGWRQAFLRNGLRESEILQGVDGVLGRTDWDRAEAWAANPRAEYFIVNELMRAGFWDAQPWEVRTCRRNVLMATNLRMPLKGVDTLLNAMAILRRVIPDVRLKVAAGIARGSGYGRHLARKIAHLGIGNAIDLMGYLSEAELVKELRSSHCFVAPSLIDNSPNSVCEAMLVGLPVVATYVGGVPSLIRHTGTGLLAPPREAALLAHWILRVLTDDMLATSLGCTARREARDRHATEKVVAELLAAYEAVASTKRHVIGGHA